MENALTIIQRDILKLKLVEKVEIFVNDDNCLIGINSLISDKLHMLRVPKSVYNIDLQEDKVCAVCSEFTLSGKLGVVSGLRYLNGLKKISLNNVDILARNCFANLKSLQSFKVSSVSHIGFSCFYGCSNLQSFDFSCLKCGCVVEECAFISTGLRYVNTENLCNVTFKGHCFSYCDSIKELYLQGVCSFGESCFSNCTNLKNIVIEDDVEIGDLCFSSCSSLENVIIKNFNSVRNAENIFRFCGNVKIDIYGIDDLSDDVIEQVFSRYATNVTCHSGSYRRELYGQYR